MDRADRDLSTLRMSRAAQHADGKTYMAIESALLKEVNPEPPKVKVNRALARIAKAVNG